MIPTLSARFYKLIVSLVLGLLISPALLSAQDAGTPIEIIGVISQINADTITVAGMTVDTESVTLDGSIVVGATVKVTGKLLATNVIVAQTVIINIVITPEATSEATPEATAEATPAVTPSPTSNPNVIIVIEGPVINIVTNIITIYDFDIEVEPQNPILNIISIGDLIRVEGATGNNGIVIATVISNISSTTIVNGGTATVGLEGPVEAINGSIIVVNGVPVQLAANDPLLQTVQVGTFVSVQGNFEGSGANIVLVVVNIVIVNNVIVNNDPSCWYHEGMGMGHWHCDGMGMGMGMGEGMGMGMGMGG